jgi:hypothetical protein
MSGCDIGVSVRPTFTERAVSTSCGSMTSAALPTAIAVEPAMQRSPAQPKAAVARASTDLRDVGVRHDDDVVLRSAVGLHAFSILGAGLVDVLRHGRRADEGYGPDLGVGEERVHAFAAPVDDVQDAFWESGLLQELNEEHHREGHLFAGLEDEGVPAGDREGEHPEGDHRREIEGSDADADAERLEHGLAVDVACDVFKRVAEKQRRGAAGVFDVLNAAVEAAPGLDERLPVLERHRRADPVEFTLDDVAVTEEQARPLDRRRVPPRGKRGRRGLDGGGNLGGAPRRALGDYVAGRWIENRRAD